MLSLPPRRESGMTLLEVLLALGILALLSLMSWRGIDGMLRNAEVNRQFSQGTAPWQAALQQWRIDHDRRTEQGGLVAWDWDGQVLRITRTASDPAQGLQVVAWALIGPSAPRTWQRWQSPPLRDRGAWQTAWEQARLWGRGESLTQAVQATMIGPAFQWQLYVDRDGQWSHPLSSGDRQPPTQPTQPGGAGGGEALARAVRLQIELPEGGPWAGRLTLDWMSGLGAP